MNELSLFTGSGGGVLGGLLLGWRSIGYVEYDDYCQRVLAQRIKDGHLHEAPIFGDIRTFISEGFATSYQGMVDVISAGFPCQPFSVAGKRAGEDDPRNMWPATIECIRIVRPRYAFLENVPGLISSGYFGTILGDLSESGYDARWRVLSAAELGAPHKRDRLWIVANTGSVRCDPRRAKQSLQGNWSYGENEQLAHPTNAGNVGRQRLAGNDAVEGKERGNIRGRSYSDDGCQDVSDTTIRGLEGEITTRQQRRKQGLSAECDWWKVEPDVGRVVDGMAHRVDRLRAIGNGQVSAVAAAAWRLLAND